MGLAASSSASAAASAAAHGVPFWTDNPAALAARDDVDLVVVTVKVPHHKALVDQALAAGKAIYCEWPLAKSLAEAESMTRDAGVSNASAFVGLQARSAPAIRYLRDLVCNGYVGEVLSASVVGSGGFPWGGIATAGLAYVNDASTGATMLTIPFGHMIDSFTWIMGNFRSLCATLATRRPAVRLLDYPQIVRATAPDQVAASGTLENGAVVSLHYRGGTSPGTNFLWEINGTAGSLVVTAPDGHLQYGHIRIQGSQGEAPLADLPIPESYRRVDTDPAGYADAVAHAYVAVHDALRSDDNRAPRFGDALATHRLLDRIMRTAEAGLRSET